MVRARAVSRARTLIRYHRDELTSAGRPFSGPGARSGAWPPPPWLRSERRGGMVWFEGGGVEKREERACVSGTEASARRAREERGGARARGRGRGAAGSGVDRRAPRSNAGHLQPGAQTRTDDHGDVLDRPVDARGRRRLGGRHWVSLVRRRTTIDALPLLNARARACVNDAVLSEKLLLSRVSRV